MKNIRSRSTEKYIFIRIFIIIISAVLFISVLFLINRPASAEDSLNTVSRTCNITKSPDKTDKPEAYEIKYSTYVVREGDTIWSIADKNMTDDFPTYRSFIEEVMRANRMHDSSIYPGDLIIIPADNEN